MTAEIQALCADRVFQHFYEICQIPHGSGNEKGVSDYLLHWARGLGLEAEQDRVLNVLIRKPASPGREDQPVVMLQAHMDMVCEKAVGVEHDFARDPVRWVIDGDILSTGGRTTLGADDGIGVALAMAILEDGRLSHPALEVLFTVMEEEDFTGAGGFDASKMNASYLINLDNTSDREIICGSCGGMQADIQIPVPFEPTPAGWTTCRLSISGLKGGHSGEDIHRGRGNANILLARLLMAAEACCDYRLAQIRGGSFRLAIPREAEAILCLDPAQIPALKETLAGMEAEFRAELAATAQRVTVSLALAPPAERCARPATVITALTLIPDGIYQMNEVLTGLVDTSDNLGEVYLDPDRLHCVLEIRSARNSLRTYLFQRLERLAALLGGSCRWCSAYPSWEFRPDSHLRQVCSRVYEDMFGFEPRFLTVHAGLEVGYFFQHRLGLDAVSIGPNCRDFHSPTEALEISSVKKVYGYLCRLLAAMP